MIQKYYFFFFYNYFEHHSIPTTHIKDLLFPKTQQKNAWPGKGQELIKKWDLF